jgi:DNA-binding beta-propeller fold protein YncE
VLKFNQSNKLNGVGSVGNSLFEGLATDSAGNVYVIGLDTAKNGPFVSTIFKFTPSGQESVFASLPSQGFGLTFDSAGNLYAAADDFLGDSNDQTIFKFTPDGTRTVFVGPSYFTSGEYPVGLAFDSMGNLFVSTESFNGTPTDQILKFSPDGKVESIIATGLTMPRGMAFDGSGNLFVAEERPFPDGDILEFVGGGGPATVFASGLGGPQFLTFGPPR